MRAEGRRASATGGRRRRGFTLVELAVVVLIIGILLAFILAAAFGSVERAREICGVLGGVPDRDVELDEFEGRHRISGRRAYSFLQERLQS